MDRFNRERALQSLEECSKKVIQQKLSVFIFPEGTRNHGDGMIEFKKGAFNLAIFVSLSFLCRGKLTNRVRKMCQAQVPQ